MSYRVARGGILTRFSTRSVIVVAVAVSADPSLSNYAIAVTWTVVVQMGKWRLLVLA